MKLKLSLLVLLTAVSFHLWAGPADATNCPCPFDSAFDGTELLQASEPTCKNPSADLPTVFTTARGSVYVEQLRWAGDFGADGSSGESCGVYGLVREKGSYRCQGYSAWSIEGTLFPNDYCPPTRFQINETLDGQGFRDCQALMDEVVEKALALPDC